MQHPCSPARTSQSPEPPLAFSACMRLINCANVINVMISQCKRIFHVIQFVAPSSLGPKLQSSSSCHSCTTIMCRERNYKDLPKIYLKYILTTCPYFVAVPLPATMYLHSAFERHYERLRQRTRVAVPPSAPADIATNYQH